MKYWETGDIYSIVKKGHKKDFKQSNGDYFCAATSYDAFLNRACFSLGQVRNREELNVKDETDDPEMIPIRATIISAIFVIPYVIIFQVFRGFIFTLNINCLNRSWKQSG